MTAPSPISTAPRTEKGLSDRAQAERQLLDAFASFPRFCGLLKIPPKDGGPRIDFRFSPIQRAYNKARTSRDIILKPRQVYMTTLEAARDLWWFLTKPGARVTVVCQSQTDQVSLKDLNYKFRVFIDSLRQIGVNLTFGAESASEYTLPKKDATLRIIQAGASEASAEKKGRGGTINRLHFTEAAVFEHAEETFNSLMESVPRVGSEVVNESTPNGAAGFYYEQWRAAVEGRSSYTPHFFRWWEHPEYRIPLEPSEKYEPESALERTLFEMGVPVECLKWYRGKVREKGGNERLVGQEFPSDPDTCFLLSGRSFFDVKRVDLLLMHAVDPIASQYIREGGAYGQLVKGVEIPAIRIWHPPQPDSQYVIGVDVSEGTGGDPSAGIVLERGTGRHMATIWGQFRPWELGRVVSVVGRMYNNALAAVERNNHGHACLRALETEHKYADRVFYDRDGEHGWLNTETTRAPTLDTFEHAFRLTRFSTHDRFMLQEMRQFTVNDRGRAEHPKTEGSHGDLIMAGAIGYDVICRREVNRRDLANLPKF